MAVSLCHLLEGCLNREEGFLKRPSHTLHIVRHRWCVEVLGELVLDDRPRTFQAFGVAEVLSSDLQLASFPTLN